VVLVGRDLKDHLVPMALPWAGTSSTRPGCSKPNPAWPSCIMPRTIFAWPLGNPLMKSGSELGPEKKVLIAFLLLP